MLSTAGSSVGGIAYVIAVAASVLAAAVVLGDLERLLRRPSRGALGLWLGVAVPSLVQLAVPGLLDALGRRPDLIRDGEVWRLLTSVVVQDGGWFGTAFNLVLLYVVGCVAVALWGTWRAVLLFVLGAVGFNLLATYVADAAGAGNSGATFCLAASMATLAVIRRRTARTIVAVLLVAAVGVVLLVVRDAHGAAFLGGLALGVLLAPTRTRPAGRAGNG